MKEYIECPQFGNIAYGKWGTLNLKQRKLIKRLLEEMDRADVYIRELYEENMRLKKELALHGGKRIITELEVRDEI